MGLEAHGEGIPFPLLAPFWGAMDWDSSEIPFLEETVPPSPCPDFVTWLITGRPFCSAKNNYSLSPIFLGLGAHTAGRTSHDFYAAH